VPRRLPARADKWALRRAIAGGLALGAASGANILNVGAVPDQLAEAFGVNLATVGLFTTVLLLAHTVVQLPGGRAVDRFGARRIGLVLLGVAVVGNAVITAAAEPAVVLGLRPLVGLSTGIGFVAGIAYIRAAGGSALAQGVFGGVAMGGGALALAVVPQLEPALDWRAPFVFGLGVSVAAALLLLLGPRDSWVADRVPTARVSMLEVATDRRLSRLVVLHTATFGSGLLVGTWVVALLVRLDHSQGIAGAVGALTLALTIVSRPLGGWLLQRYPQRIGWALAGSLVIGALGCAGLAAGGPVGAAAVSACAVGIGAGIAFAPIVTSAMWLRPDAPGTAVGAVNMWGNLVVLAATPLLGLAFSVPSGGRIAFLAVAALWAAALLSVPGIQQLGARAASAPAFRSAGGEYDRDPKRTLPRRAEDARRAK
jgi:MFS family permease